MMMMTHDESRTQRRRDNNKPSKKEGGYLLALRQSTRETPARASCCGRERGARGPSIALAIANIPVCHLNYFLFETKSISRNLLEEISVSWPFFNNAGIRGSVATPFEDWAHRQH